ncbi:MAG: MFS transporter, partial [Thermoproteales archaeon]|nr:MFS transporter [Thermoproteales archaeon]
MKLKPLLELRSRRNFLVLLFRRVYTGFFNSLPQQYTSLYVVSIGFSIVDLGVMRSFASLASSIVNPIVGFIADIKGRKKAFTIVLLVEMLGALFYFIACDWNTLALAVVFSFTSMLAATNIENIFIADIIRRRTRATGFSIMNFLSRVSVTISPLIAAYIVDTFGGIGAEGIRPLFLIQVVGLSLCAIPAFLLLEETLSRKTVESFSQVVDDVKEIVYELKEHYWLRLWILVEVFGGYVWATTMPYLMIYAVDIKGADAWILGYMGASFNIASLAATIPWGRIGDKIGRVKTILLARPLFYLST